MRHGIVTYNIAKDWDLETIFKHCEAVGLQGVELRTTHAHKVEVSLTQAERARVRQRFEGSPVDLVALGTACEFHAGEPEVVRRNIDETKRFVVLAHDVGAEAVKVRPNGLIEGVDQESTLRQIGTAFAECAEFAAGYGVKVTMEVHGRGTSSIPKMGKILEHANHPNAWITWNCNPTDLEDGGLEKNLRRVGSKIAVVHLRDLYSSYPSRDLFRWLQSHEFDGYCLAEIPGSTDPLRVLRYFRALFEEMNRPL